MYSHDQEHHSYHFGIAEEIPWQEGSDTEHIENDVHKVPSEMR